MLTPAPSNKNLRALIKGATTKIGKVFEIVKYYGTVHKDIIEIDLDEFKIPRKKITTLLKDLKRQGKVESHHKNLFQLEGTMGVVPKPNFAEKFPREQLLLWFSQILFFHNIRGTFTNCKFNKLQWSKNQESKEFALRNTPNASIKIIRNFDTIQFFFVCKRPGFLTSGIIEAIGLLYQKTLELGIQGEPVVTLFEARNSRSGIVIPELKGLHFRIPLFGSLASEAKLVGKAYQEENALQTEVEFNTLQYQFSDLLNAAQSLQGGVEFAAGIQQLSNKIEETKTTQDLSRREIVKNGIFVENQLERNSILLKKVNKELKSNDEYSKSISNELFSIRNSIKERQRNDVVEDLYVIVDTLIEKIQVIENRIIESETEAKKWRELDQISRIELLDDLKNEGLSFEDISIRLEASISTIHEFYKKYVEPNDMVPSKPNDMVPSKNLVIIALNKNKDIILEFVKANPGCSKNAICNHLTTGSKQSRLELINSMVQNNLLEATDHPTNSRRKLYFIQEEN